MSLSEQFTTDDLHPIDIVEHLAEHHDWDFDRVAEDQIAMAVEGQWRTYSITLAWSPADETLRLICTFEMEPPEDRLGPALRDAEPRQRPVLGGRLHLVGRAEPDGLPLRAGAGRRAVRHARADRHDDRRGGPVGRAVLPGVPARRLERPDPAQAMQVAIAEAYGRA
jgi:hypothetical protein